MQETAGTSPFRAQCLISVTGELDRERLKAAIGEAVHRHEILRTSFANSGAPEGVLQIVHQDQRFVVDEVSLESMRPDKRQESITRLWSKALEAPLDSCRLSACATLVALSCREHAILIALPALCADVPALENLTREISRIYAARGHGESSPGGLLQYGDLAVWQNELLEAQELRIGREYWARFDLGSPSIHALPFRTEVSSQAGFAVREFASRLTPGLALRIRQTAQKYGKSVDSLVLACWGILMGRSSGMLESTIGVACDGRKYEELKNAIGLFAKFLPLTVSCPAEAPFTGVWTSVEEALTANCKWQECFAWREFTAGSAIFPINFEYVSEFQSWSAGDVGFKIERHWACCDRFRIRLSCQQQNGHLATQIHYDAHYFQEEEIRFLSERLHTILECAAGAPETVVSDLRILGPCERRQVLVEFSVAGRRPLTGLCFHQMFEQQVERTPDSFAIVTGQGCLTYRDLNRRSNQLARYLRRHGIVVESRVAILMERSPEMFVAVLAVLKAGAAYVPLDPRYPAERISFVLADAAPAVVLAQRPLMEKLAGLSVRAICVDDIKDDIAFEGESNISAQLDPECLFYVIYTSGSTGKPKGSMVSHRAIMNHAAQMAGFYSLGPGARMLQFFPLSFDASAEDIFPSLISGATLVCPPDAFAYSPSELLAFCERFEVTTFHLPVVLWHRLVEELSNRGSSLPTRVRTLSVGGESPSASDLALWDRVTGGRVAFRNMYGPTEATITATVYQHNGPASGRKDRIRVPIGRPLANVPVYLLDAAMEVVPVGMPGEIYIGGAALARGYVNLPGETAERFVPDPFSEHPGARLYKTGDLGQFLAGGEIEFLGRIDHQVKIRGFRIELPEIERILAQHPAVKDAVVTVHDDGARDKRLAAYVTLKSDQRATARQMRSHLREHVPDYMLPTWFVVLNSLPLNFSGKVDRNALPAPTSENLGTEQEYVAPRSATEAIVAAIFAEILQKNQVGALDHFFESGGHSLLAMQLAGRLLQAFEVEVSLRRIFDDPTVAGVAAALLEEENERSRVESIAERMVQSATVPGAS